MIKDRGFNGSRLKSARLYRTKTIELLSKETSISIDNINNFENNKSIPSIENILSLSKVLNFPKEYFSQRDNLDITVEGSYFNVHPSNYRKEELSYIEKIVLTHKIFNFIERYITCPKLDIINFSAKDYDIEDIALKVRTKYGLDDGPIMNMVNIMEVNGFIVSTINSGKNSVGPFIQKHKIYDIPKYFMALGNDKKSVPKRNYDLAVQLGHVVLHDFCVDQSTLSKEEFKNIKEEANKFARAFILPKESFLEDLVYPQDLEYYVELKGKYIAPIDIMILRAYELGTISHRKYEYLLKEMASRGWNKKEPLEEIKGANPFLSKKAIEVLEENNIISGSGLVTALANEGISLYSEEIEDLLGLKRGKLSPKQNAKNIKNSNVTVLNFGR